MELVEKKSKCWTTTSMTTTDQYHNTTTKIVQLYKIYTNMREVRDNQDYNLWQLLKKYGEMV